MFPFNKYIRGDAILLFGANLLSNTFLSLSLSGFGRGLECNTSALIDDKFNLAVCQRYRNSKTQDVVALSDLYMEYGQRLTTPKNGLRLNPSVF